MSAPKHLPILLRRFVFALLFFLSPLLFTQCNDENDDFSAPEPELTDENFPISLNGTPCAPDIYQHKLYCPILPSSGTSIKARFAHYQPDTPLYIDGQPYVPGQSVTLKNWRDTHHTLRIGDDEEEWQLVLTTLPVVCLTVDPGVNSEQFVCGEFTLLDPCARTARRKRFPHYAHLRHRGASSLQFLKKSYAIKFRDEATGQKMDYSILGMRSDDDLILDAMYIDHSRMRNRVCTDIWNSFSRLPYGKSGASNLNGTQGYFVEVVRNKQYDGLYCLTDKIDRKKLQLKKTDETPSGIGFTRRGLLYKGKNWTAATALWGYDEDTDNTLAWQGWEQKYPDDYDVQACWQPLKELIDFSSNPEHFRNNPLLMQDLSRYTYLENLLDYILLTQVLYLEDNMVKNTYLSQRDTQQDSRFLFTPWDMDMSLGRNYLGQKHSFLPFNHGMITQCGLFGNLITYGNAEFRTALRKRWDKLKTGPLSVEAVSRIIYTYRDQFQQCGVWEREKALWHEYLSDLDEETEYMIASYARNIQAVNEFLSQF